MRERQATSFTVTYPKRNSASLNGFSSRQRPRADIAITCEDGSQQHRWVPSRVARAFEKDPGEFPRPCTHLLDTIGELERAQCFTALTEMLSRRDHSVKEAHDKLITLGFREPEVDEALRRAECVRLLDDMRFAASFIDERMRRGWGRRKVELELHRRGIDPSMLPDYPEAYFSYDEDFERASALLRKKQVPQTRPFEKFVRFLVGKGFPYDVAIAAVRAHLEAADELDDVIDE